MRKNDNVNLSNLWFSYWSNEFFLCLNTICSFQKFQTLMPKIWKWNKKIQELLDKVHVWELMCQKKKVINFSNLFAFHWKWLIFKFHISTKVLHICGNIEGIFLLFNFLEIFFFASIFNFWLRIWTKSHESNYFEMNARYSSTKIEKK